MPKKSELDEIREITNTEPAPAPDTPPPMVCPACGEVMVGGKCKNERCENYEA